MQLKAYESSIFGQCSDVPLRLETLFGIVRPEAAEGKAPGQAEAEAIAAQDSGAASNEVGAQSEEQKSEAKALTDAEE